MSEHIWSGHPKEWMAKLYNLNDLEDIKKDIRLMDEDDAKNVLFEVIKLSRDWKR